jgi:phage FluMu protein Com
MFALLRFACDQCGKTLKAPPGLAGKKCKCPRCGDVLVIQPGTQPAPVKEEVAVPCVIKTSSRLLSVLEGLIGPIPYGFAALARWHKSNTHALRFVASVLCACRGKRAANRETDLAQRMGCIALRDRRLHLFDFGTHEGDVRVLESHLSNLVRLGLTPSVLSAPLSSLAITRTAGVACKSVRVTGALELSLYPGVGDDFPAPLWLALAGSESQRQIV